MAGASRPVRIRRGGPRVSAETPTVAFGPAMGAPGPGLPNVAALQRSARLFLFFVLLLVALLLVFLGAQLSSPYAAVRTEWPASLALAAIALFAAAAGYALTLARTPVSVRAEGENLVIRERSGRERRISAGSALAPSSVRAHPPMLFAREWTETVELEWPGGVRRAYLFERGLLRRALTGRGPD
ncbi:MAG TPA: hypothetical protein VGU43_07185 [Thermoplasmata archaeon]|nr:hypothetical protein [Thermoplasmata archaeon]